MFKILDDAYKKTGNINYSTYEEQLNNIKEFYSSNNDKLTKEDLYNRKYFLKYKQDAYKNVTIPTLVTVIFGVMMLITTIVYTELRSEIFGDFINSVKEIATSHGFTVNDLPQNAKDIVDEVTLQIWVAFVFIVIIMMFGGYVYYRLLKSNLKRNIKQNTLIEMEVKIVEAQLEKTNENHDISLSISNGHKSLLYKLMCVENTD